MAGAALSFLRADLPYSGVELVSMDAIPEYDAARFCIYIYFRLYLGAVFLNLHPRVG
jgi:hypothetical protein